MAEFQDVEAMMAAANAAGEDTGEGDVGGKETLKAEETPKVVVETKAQEDPRATEVPKAKEIPKIEETPKVERTFEAPKPVIESKPPVRENVAVSPSNRIVNSAITEASIGKVLDMNSIFNKFNEVEQRFVSDYFQVQVGKADSVSKVIFSALTASQRELDALSKIVTARGETAAERAFYLMGLDNGSILAIHEQVDLLVGELDEIQNVNELNKISICRTIEKAIAEMPADLFAYIDKLQLFTNSALPE